MCLSGSSFALSLGFWIPILLLEVSRSQLPICLKMSSYTSLPVSTGHPACASQGQGWDKLSPLRLLYLLYFTPVPALWAHPGDMEGYWVWGLGRASAPP